MKYKKIYSTDKKVLHLIVHSRWFNMIARGEMTETYKQMSKYWSRVIIETYGSKPKLKHFDQIIFRSVNSDEAPLIIVECKGIEIGKPLKKWCSNEFFSKEDKAFVISLGEVLFCNAIL